MIEKIFGEKKSIQRNLIIQFTIATISIVIVTLIGFYLLVNNQALEKLIQINVNTKEEIKELLSIIRRSVGLIILNTLVIGAVTIKISAGKMLKPITKLNEATKKVAQGNFNIQLETQRNDEIGELTTNFNKMVKDLGSIELLQKEFIDNVSHEIKTPISSIEGFAELLEAEDLTKEERIEYSNIIKEEANRLLNLSTNMLKLSKLQNQSKIIAKDEINIAEQIRKAITLLEPKWSEKEIIFNVSLEERYFIGDEDLIFQIWVNLIGNAIKFSKQNGKIEITLKQKADFLEITIKDNGKGMNNEEISRIFTRFYQIDKSHSTEGNGLGLAIVKRIIDLSEGLIEVQSQENNGTTMIIQLPLQEKENKILI